MMVLGGSFPLTAPGGSVDVHVSAGSANGAVVSFRSKGMPNVGGHGRGALHVRLVVDVPKRLTKEQKKAVEQLSKAMPAEPIAPREADSEIDKPFFEKVRDLFG
jgi:molecular chaperone DnaJ